MVTKGVFLLGLVVCWTAVCNAEYGSVHDYGLRDKLSKLLAEEELVLAYGGENVETGDEDTEDDNEDNSTTEDGTTTGDFKDVKVGTSCTENSDCGERQKCAGDEGSKTCQCVAGLSGANCEANDWCDTGKFKNCKGDNGTCEYVKDKRSVDCTCKDGKRLNPEENRCRETCKSKEDCENGVECTENFCVCKPGLIGDKCEIIVDCEEEGTFRGCNSNGGKCTFNGISAICTCTTAHHMYHPTEHTCKDTCSTSEDCQNGGTCESNFCTCEPGLIGDKCETLFECTKEGKFRGCSASGGTCTLEGPDTVCRCPANQQYDDTEHTCKDCSCGINEICKFEDGKKNCDCNSGFAIKDGICTVCDCGPDGKCSFENGQKTCDCIAGFVVKDGKCTGTKCENDSGCKKRQKCREAKGSKTCQCADGLSGDDCEVEEWCTGKFKDCKGLNGSCEYSAEDKKLVCKCGLGKELHPKENRCRDTCSTNEECHNGGTCEGKFCICKPRLFGDRCESIFDCTKKGKFRGCVVSGGRCTHDGTNALCICPINQQYDDTEHVCKNCDCGSNGKCRFENGQKKCDCDTGYLEKDGICTATCSNDASCRDNQTCKEKNSWKTCVCAEGLSGANCEKKDWCESTGKFKNCKGVNGTCEYVKSKRSVDCTCDTGKSLHPTEKRCRDTCVTEADCMYGGTCSNSFCTCKEGFFGDKCQIIFDCSSEGKYKDCVKSGGTCSHDGTNTVCTCPSSKKLHDTENICKAACAKDDECKYGGTCKNNICSCLTGLTGDKCETIIDCEANGRFKNCESSGGKCTFEGNNAVCNCSSNQKYHETEHTCKATCSKHDECKDNQACKEINGWKECACADGLSGTNCENQVWCEDNGKYDNCKGVNGTCAYVQVNRTVECTCAAGKALHPTENRCRDTCSTSADCKNEGTCENNFCTCKLGIIGDKCEIVFDCSPQGKYKDCARSGGTCTHVGTNAVCTCPDKKKLHDKEHVCKECDCGPQGRCYFENGEKKCECDKGFAVRSGICTATCSEHKDCKDNQACKDKSGWKSCVCADGLSGTNCENKFWCEGTGKFKNCKDTNGTCEYIKEKRAVGCTCIGGKELHPTEGRCRDICGTNDDCQNGGTCSNKFCICKPGLIGDKCETAFDCTPKGKYKDCFNSGGTCTYDASKAVCTCPEHKRLHATENICKEFCTAKEECNGGECIGEEGKKICNCKGGLKGDRCTIAVDCEEGGKYAKCEKSGGVCNFNNSRNVAECICSESKALDNIQNICREKCEPNGCKNEGTCDAQKLCRCKPGTSGDKCETVDGCGVLKCEDKGATCIFKNGQARCECNDKSYYFDNNECKPKWCIDGCNTKISDCEYKNGVGICKCKNEGTYYDYVAGKCEPFDKCVNKSCDAGKVCKNGDCECDNNHDKKDDKCEPKNFCDKGNNKCFPSAHCEISSPVGYVKCSCNGTNFYNPRTRRCEDGACFLPEHRKDCKKPCPRDMIRTNGLCTHKTENTKCDKDCGTLGWCYKVSDTVQVCECEPGVTEKEPTSGKCLLKGSTVCPTQERDGDAKCKCTGKYKPAKDGVTCELKSCSDQEVKDECKKKRAAKCLDSWKVDGYKCVCPDGYVDDPKKGCIDPCSMDSMKDTCRSQGKKCYIGSKIKEGDCKCLPTFTENPTSKACEPNGKNTMMIKSLPVLSKKYEDDEKNINQVLLNMDVSNSMKKTFKNLDFVYVYSFKVQEELLLCDVWLQFKLDGLPENFNVSLEAQRWKSLTVDVANRKLLPPALFLSSSLDKATEEELTLCSSSVQQSVCGRGSRCVDNKCTCQENYREIDSTIQSYGDKKRIVRCEAIDLCKEGIHKCPANSKCVNLAGDYFCKCHSGYRKKEGAADEIDKKECIGLCEGNPCGKGECKIIKNNIVDCTCQVGYSGSFCNKKDERLAKASQSTKVVGAVLGTLLAIVILLIIVYIVRQRKNAYSEDFTPPPRNDNAEMVERRPMRGVTNRAYQ